MKNKNVLFILFLLCSFILAQQNDFTVLSSSGNVSVKKLQNNGWEKCKLGQRLKPDYEINLTASSYLNLITDDDKVVQLNKEGTYKVKDLYSKIQNTKTSAKNIAQTFSKILKQKFSGESKDTILGASERVVASTKLSIFFPRNQTALSSMNVVFKWQKHSLCNNFDFKIYDGVERLIYQQKVNDTTLTLDLANLKLKNDVYYIWSINCEKDVATISKEYFKVLPSEKIEAIVDTLKEIEISLNLEPESPLEYITKAIVYDNNTLYQEAIENYEKAIELVPTSYEYKRDYANFLIRIGLYAKAKKLMQEVME